MVAQFAGAITVATGRRTQLSALFAHVGKSRMADSDGKARILKDRTPERILRSFEVIPFEPLRVVIQALRWVQVTATPGVQVADAVALHLINPGRHQVADTLKSSLDIRDAGLF